MCDFSTNEKLTSQIPALQLLVVIGQEYISPEAALTERQGRYSNVLLPGYLWVTFWFRIVVYPCISSLESFSSPLIPH